MKKLKDKKILIKLGGSVLGNNEKMINICIDIKNLKNAGADVVVVHGGGKNITKALNVYSLETLFVDGLRVTPKDHVEILQMTLYLLNKKISKVFSNIGLKGVGVSGEDSSLLICNFYDKQKYGYVGLIKKINSDAITKMLSQDLIPIVATVGITENFETVNINADDVAAELAKELDVDELIYLTDQDGVFCSNGGLISQLSSANIDTLINEDTAIGGMKIKLNSIKPLLENQKRSITILNGTSENILIEKVLLGKKNIGTTCVFEEKL